MLKTHQMVERQDKEEKDLIPNKLYSLACFFPQPKGKDSTLYTIIILYQKSRKEITKVQKHLDDYGKTQF